MTVTETRVWYKTLSLLYHRVGAEGIRSLKHGNPSGRRKTKCIAKTEKNQKILLVRSTIIETYLITPDRYQKAHNTSMTRLYNNLLKIWKSCFFFRLLMLEDFWGSDKLPMTFQYYSRLWNKYVKLMRKWSEVWLYKFYLSLLTVHCRVPSLAKCY